MHQPLRVGVLESTIGEIPEWPNGADCKSVGNAFGGSNPPLPTFIIFACGSSSFGRAAAFQAAGGGFETRLPLFLFADVAQW